MKTLLYSALVLTTIILLQGCVPLEIRVHFVSTSTKTQDGDDGFYGQEIPKTENGW